MFINLSHLWLSRSVKELMGMDAPNEYRDERILALMEGIIHLRIKTRLLMGACRNFYRKRKPKMALRRGAR